jgi:membrane-associated protein
MHFDLIAFIKAIGYIGVFFVVFAESGLLIGFFFPGDSLLFTAGFLASQGFLHISVLIIGCFICAVAGDSVGYTFGHKIGKRLFHREDSLFFHKDNLLRAKAFYEQHGKKTIILARFMPIVRTFAPIVAGIGDMHYTTFLAYNVIGGFFWAVGVTSAGYYLGNLIPDVDRYLLPIVLLIIFVSIAPSLHHVLRDRERRQRTMALAKRSVRSLIQRVLRGKTTD